MKLKTIVVALVAFNLMAFANLAGDADQAETIIRDTDYTGGLIVEVGCGDGELTAALGESTDGMVQGIDMDRSHVLKSRERVRTAGLGGRVSARAFDGQKLPYADNMVNLLVFTDNPSVSKREMLRVLTPLGKVWINGRTRGKPWPEDMDEWSHYLHGPDNNAVARDKRLGLPRSIQWKCGPDWGRSHEELAGMSTAVTAKGRMFYIIDDAPLLFIRFPSRWKLVARDAFNGRLLWEKPIENWVDDIREFRSGPAHLSRRLVADGERVYATLGLDAPVTAFDAASGEKLKTYKGTEYTEEIIAANNLLYLVAGTSEQKRRGPGLFDKGEPKPSDFRYISAIDADSGATVWKHDYSGSEYLLPLSMAVKGDRIVYKTTEGIVCLDSRSGKKIWQTEEPTPVSRAAFSAPTVVIADGVVLCADRVVKDRKNAAKGPIEWGVGGWGVGKGIARHSETRLHAYAIADGKKLWDAPCKENYNAPVDVFVLDDKVYVSTGYTGYDLKTGQKLMQLNRKSPPVSMGHHRCHRNKATLEFMINSASGIELFDWEKGWIGNNSWIRGTCQYGILPANGLLYAPPNPCACNAAVKVNGFFAAAPKRGETFAMPMPDTPLLIKGPAYGQSEAKSAGSQDWPMYRHDNRRDGAVETRLGSKLKTVWRAQIADAELTQPVVVGGLMLVAAKDEHTVYALDADSGQKKWHFTAGGRIDSSPTIYKGEILFGSADGWVYCLDRSSGELAWQFRAAPDARQVGVDDQLESAWPAHGSVVVQNDILYCSAGRSSYLDGGIVLYRLDPVSGKLLSHNILSDIDPQTGAQTGTEKNNSGDMEGVRSDIMSGDGEHLFMKHLVFDSSGEEIKQQMGHLFSPTGMLENPWFVRGFWRYAKDHGTGWPKWAQHPRGDNFGRILCRDGDTIYGFGRRRIKGGRTGHRLDRYHLFAQNSWSRDEFPLIVRAMVVGQNNLAVIGTPAVGKRADNRHVLRFTNAGEALAAFEGEKGVQLKLVSKQNGKELYTLELDTLPVFDGLSAANGKLYASLQDGSVICLAGE